jgi:hypothetical protein
MIATAVDLQGRNELHNRAEHQVSFRPTPYLTSKRLEPQKRALTLGRGALVLASRPCARPRAAGAPGALSLSSELKRAGLCRQVPPRVSGRVGAAQGCAAAAALRRAAPSLSWSGAPVARVLPSSLRAPAR